MLASLVSYGNQPPWSMRLPAPAWGSFGWLSHTWMLSHPAWTELRPRFPSAGRVAGSVPPLNGCFPKTPSLPIFGCGSGDCQRDAGMHKPQQMAATSSLPTEGTLLGVPPNSRYQLGTSPRKMPPSEPVPLSAAMMPVGEGRRVHGH